MRETAGRLLREIITIKGSRQVLTEETNKEGQRNKETKRQRNKSAVFLEHLLELKKSLALMKSKLFITYYLVWP